MNVGDLLSAAKLSWETPFRWGASLLAISTVATGFHNPVGGLADAARYLWLHSVADAMEVIDTWLSLHVLDFAVLLALMITLAICGAYRGSATITEPRASSTFWYFFALAAYVPDQVIGGWAFLLVGLVIGFIVAHVRGLGGVRGWVVPSSTSSTRRSGSLLPHCCGSSCSRGPRTHLHLHNVGRCGASRRPLW